MAEGAAGVSRTSVEVGNRQSQDMVDSVLVPRSGMGKEVGIEKCIDFLADLRQVFGFNESVFAST